MSDYVGKSKKKKTDLILTLIAIVQKDKSTSEVTMSEGFFMSTTDEFVEL